MLNTRRTGSRPLFRATARSGNRGATWSAVTHDMGLPSSGVQGSILRYSLASLQDANRVIFSNPANNESTSANARTRMTVRVSNDEAQTWSHSRELHAGWSAYSSLVVSDDFQIGCLYEWGTTNRYERFLLEVMSLEWLTDGEDSTPQVPLPPAVVTAELLPGADGIVIMWQPSEQATGYEVLRYKAGTRGTASIIANVGAEATSWEDQNIESMAGYYYRVRACSDDGASHDSAPAFVSTAPEGVILVPDFFPTIEGAVRAASNGDEIRVASTHLDRSHGVELHEKNITIRSYAAEVD
jgi:hypothetical protein